MLDHGNIFEEPLSVTRNYSLSLNVVCESIKGIFKFAIYCRERLTILHIDQLFKNLKVKTQIHSRPVESELKISVPVLLCCLDPVMAILSSNS